MSATQGPAASESPLDNAHFRARLELLSWLQSQDYAFVTPTPLTHARVTSRSSRQYARHLRDILGWSLPFTPSILEPKLLSLLERAGMIEKDGRYLRALLRVSSLQGELYLHSAFPTTAEDAVFLGPDSYRFASVILSELQGRRLQKPYIVDMGTGAGVGGIVAGKACGQARVTMTDINPWALKLARINAEAAGVSAEYLLSATLEQVSDPIDLALANPPYLIDEDQRHYRDGGGMYGGAVALEMADLATARLAPGGTLILYTGTAIVEGNDVLGAALQQVASSNDCKMTYREIDPDVFGEELVREAYRDVERIAVVAAIMTKAT